MSKQEIVIVLISMMILLILVVLGIIVICDHYRKMQIKKKLDGIMPDAKQD